MANRVTESLLYAQSQESMARTRSKMIKTQEEAITGRKASRPSDDPVGQTRAMTLRTSGDRIEQVSQNLELANSYMNMTDASLGELSDVLGRAKELAIQMSSSTNASPDAQGSTQKEIEQLVLRVVQIGNTRLGDRYIFGGYQTTRAPFDEDGNYFGDEGTIDLEVDQGQRIGINVPGLLPFFGIGEVGAERRALREDPARQGEPTVSGELRAPASVVAEAKGVDPVEDPESFAKIQQQSGVNIFGVLKDLRDGLQNGQLKAIQKTLDGIDDAAKQVISARSLVGARQNSLRAGMASLENARVANSELRSAAEDADSIKVFSDLARHENTLKTSLETNKRILSKSLMDFLE